MRSTTKVAAPNWLQLENALLRDDAADEEIDQQDDRHRAERELLDVERDRRRPQARRPCDGARQRGHDLSQERDARHEVACGAGDRLAQIREVIDDAAVLHDRLAALEIAPVRFLEQRLLPGVRPLHGDLQPGSFEAHARPVDDPRAGGVDRLDVLQVDDRRAEGGRLLLDLQRRSLQPVAGGDGPATGQTQHDSFAGAVARKPWFSLHACARRRCGKSKRVDLSGLACSGDTAPPPTRLGSGPGRVDADQRELPRFHAVAGAHNGAPRRITPSPRP